MFLWWQMTVITFASLAVLLRINCVKHEALFLIFKECFRSYFCIVVSSMITKKLLTRYFRKLFLVSYDAMPSKSCIVWFTHVIFSCSLKYHRHAMVHIIVQSWVVTFFISRKLWKSEAIHWQIEDHYYHPPHIHLAWYNW